MQFTLLERQTLAWFALRCGNESLKAQCNLAQPIERSRNGSTIILTLCVPSGVPPVNYTNAPGAPLIQRAALFYGAGVDLWLKDGFIQRLEFSAIGGADFPEDEFPFQLVSSLNTPGPLEAAPGLLKVTQVCRGQAQSAITNFLILFLLFNFFAAFYSGIVSSTLFIPSSEAVIYSMGLYVAVAVAFIGFLAFDKISNSDPRAKSQESLLHRIGDPLLGGLVVFIVLGGLGFGTAYIPGELIRMTGDPNVNLDILIQSKEYNAWPGKGQCRYNVKFYINSEFIQQKRCVTERFYATAVAGETMKIFAHKSSFGIVLDNQLYLR